MAKKIRKGKFIIFEGIDGSGKATQLKLLKKYLKEKGVQFRAVDFPQYYTTFFGKLAGRFLKGEFGGINEVNPYLACLPYAGDRFEAKEKIKRWLSEGKIVISNRYVGSQAHHAAKLPEKEQLKFWRFLEEMEYGVFKIPKEDWVLFFHLPVGIAQALVDQKGNRSYVGGNRRDIHEADQAHLKKTSAMFLRLARKYPRWLEINCLDKKGNLKTPEEIHKMVIKALLRRKVI